LVVSKKDAGARQTFATAPEITLPGDGLVFGTEGAVHKEIRRFRAGNHSIG
jgi:hypothetical protein